MGDLDDDDANPKAQVGESDEDQMIADLSKELSDSVCASAIRNSIICFLLAMGVELVPDARRGPPEP